jgi:transcriptional regulator with XRE-family HTH domain
MVIRVNTKTTDISPIVDYNQHNWYHLHASERFDGYRKGWTIGGTVDMGENELTLGSVIQAKREQLGLTQRQLAREVNLNHATISRIEGNPDIVADPSTLKAIAQALGIDYNYLLSLNRTIEDDKDMRIIARASKSMSEDDRERMMDILRSTFSTAFRNADSDGVGEVHTSDDY